MIDTSFDRGTNTLTIKVSGRFDFGVHQAFRKAIEQVSNTVRIVIVDLQSTDYMDSSALGMLLVLRDKINSNQQSVRLNNPKPEVRKILEIANFDRLFILQ